MGAEATPLGLSNLLKIFQNLNLMPMLLYA